ncbi:MAG TPA: enoyl-ACP reductase FabI [Amaricoccus sp.]|uniref:enoyl-ACP reductase FabI n=1 Tax=Amaricoccus sp. TaxID=1872485 RepID=UPI002B54D368|nr:enoyl-ACP reductase FabI [Amaricoccus sp.]HMQ92914.1 enoyl-ACP reductase FabI [Amaricoccus sp.]HMR52477.1 enoyl-ACP reductase FabI [Amaricoccus sp.]HMR59404.1 enoyl-ACP reductase FabI [Amaricoccus sp.]HMT99367.1 enoyl-ACP reductase FabI [Amaricoccus sp.]
MSGRRGLIMGVANDKSIAWGIAQALHEQGAEIAFTYQGEALGKRVTPLAASVGSQIVLPCDVSDEASLDATFAALGERWDRLDFLLHAIGFSDKAELRGSYTENTTAANFTQTMLVSVYSFTAAVARAAPLMSGGGSCLTLTYYGAEKVMPHYNVMGVAKAALEASVKYMAMDLGPRGIRVNALSAGPMKTLAASGIGDFRYILKWNELNSPLRRNVTPSDVGKSGLYLLSDLSSGVTGETLHVDAGYHVVGMKAEDAPDIDVVSGRKEA